jgi:chain length determinant protein EpsF
MTLYQFITILRARWRVAVGIFGVVLLMAIGLYIFMPRKYTAVASIVVDSKIDPVAAGVGLSEAVMASYINTQSDVITSERVAKKVVKAVGMDKSPEAHAAWLEKTHGEGDIDTWLARSLLSGKKIVAGPPVNSSATRQTNVIEISVKWPDPTMAAALANGFAEAAIETSLELKVEPAKQYATWFDQRSKELRAELERKQKRLSDFQNATGIIATDEKLDVENARLAELSTELVTVQSQRQDSQSRQRQAGGDNEYLPEVLQSPLITSLKDALTVAEAKRTEVAGRLGKNHPDYKASEAEVASLRARIATETAKIVASLGSTTEVNLRRESDIRQALEAQKKRVMELKHGHDEAAILLNDVTTAQRDLDAVSQRLALSNLESLAQQTNLVLLSTATPPLDPSSPKALILIAGGVFLGGVLGVVVVLLLEMRDKRVRNDADLTGVLGVPVLGKISNIKVDRPKTKSASRKLAPV